MNLYHQGFKYKPRCRGRPEREIASAFFSESDYPLARLIIPCLLGTGVVYILTTFYCIFLRGFSFSLGSIPESSPMQKNHNEMFRTIMKSNFPMKHNQELLLTQSVLSHDEVIASSAKLAAAGIWTSNHLLGPLLHILGFLAILPTWYFPFTTAKNHNSVNVGTILPLNMFTLFVSRGIPSLIAAMWLGLILTTQKWFYSKSLQKKRKISH